MNSAPKQPQRISAMSRPKRLITTRAPRYDDEFMSLTKLRYKKKFTPPICGRRAVRAKISASKQAEHLPVVDRPKRLMISQPSRYEDEFTRPKHNVPAVQPMTSTNPAQQLFIDNPQKQSLAISGLKLPLHKLPLLKVRAFLLCVQKHIGSLRFSYFYAQVISKSCF